MRSKTSCFNKTIFFKNITHFWPIWMLILAWNLFVLPFMIYNSSQQYKLMNDIGKEELEQSMSNDILSLVAVYINPVVLFIFSVVAVMAVFSYLYQARSANTIHALPVTRKELFFTNYIFDCSGNHRISDGNFSQRVLRLCVYEPLAGRTFVCMRDQYGALQF